LWQRVVIGNDDSYVTTHHLRLAGRKMKLLPPRVDPHIGWASHHLRIPREAQTIDVEQGGFNLVRNSHIHVFQSYDIAEILSGSIVRSSSRHQLRDRAGRVEAGIAVTA
jgi:hypothetical protein